MAGWQRRNGAGVGLGRNSFEVKVAVDHLIGVCFRVVRFIHDLSTFEDINMYRGGVFKIIPG